MSHKRPIVFFGTEDFSAISLRTLLEHDFNIVAVVTKPDTKRGRGRALVAPTVKTIALEHNIPVWQPVKLREIAPNLAELDSPTGVLVSFGKIIPQDIIDYFTPGIINVHPSLLPTYRGPSPIETAILNGDVQTGVSIMQLSAAMDAGPVYAQQTVTLAPDTTAPSLYESLGLQGAQLLVDTLPGIIDESITPTPQNDPTASYCRLITKDASAIDWNKPALQIEREIRAYQGWPQSTCTLASIDIVVTAGKIAILDEPQPGKIIVDKKHLFVGTGKDWLEILAVKPVGKKEMPVQAFLAGYHSKLSKQP